jgi:hypothetical protein
LKGLKIKPFARIAMSRNMCTETCVMRQNMYDIIQRIRFMIISCKKPE